jgi:phosphate-selective porin OprO/OprP
MPFGALVALLLSTGAAAQPAPPVPDPAVEKRLQELDQQVRILQRQDELRQEAEAERAKSAPSVTAGKDGFSLKSADGAWQLKLRGYLQLDGRFYRADEQRPATDTFVLRRVRPIFEGTVFKIFDFRVMPDFGLGTTVLQEAYLEGRFSPAFRLRAGKFKPPVGLERLQSGADLLFVERALPTNLVPNRDLGVQLAGDVSQGVFSYAVGIFNGVPDGASADADANDGKDVAARLFVQPFLAGGGPLKNLGFGVSASRGHQAGTVAAPGTSPYRTPGQQTFFSYRSDGTTAGTAVATGNRERLSPQAMLYAGRFGLLTEYVRSSQEVQRDTVKRDLSNTAWQVAASWVLAGGEASYRGVTPRQPFDPASHTWGAFEVAGRVERLEVDRDSFPIFANLATSAHVARAWGVGFNWYLNRSVRVLLDYQKTSFDGGAATGDREDETVYLSRFQIAF